MGGGGGGWKGGELSMAIIICLGFRTLDMKEAIVSGLYLALISKFGGVELRYLLSTKLGLK